MPVGTVISWDPTEGSGLIQPPQPGDGDYTGHVGDGPGPNVLVGTAVVVASGFASLTPGMQIY